MVSTDSGGQSGGQVEVGRSGNHVPLGVNAFGERYGPCAVQSHHHGGHGGEPTCAGASRRVCMEGRDACAGWGEAPSRRRNRPRRACTRTARARTLVIVPSPTARTASRARACCRSPSFRSCKGWSSGPDRQDATGQLQPPAAAPSAADALAMPRQRRWRRLRQSRLLLRWRRRGRERAARRRGGRQIAERAAALARSAWRASTSVPAPLPMPRSAFRWLKKATHPASLPRRGGSRDGRPKGTCTSRARFLCRPESCEASHDLVAKNTIADCERTRSNARETGSGTCRARCRERDAGTGRRRRFRRA